MIFYWKLQIQIIKEKRFILGFLLDYHISNDMKKLWVIVNVSSIVSIEKIGITTFRIIFANILRNYLNCFYVLQGDFLKKLWESAKTVIVLFIFRWNISLVIYCINTWPSWQKHETNNTSRFGKLITVIVYGFFERFFQDYTGHGIQEWIK